MSSSHVGHKPLIITGLNFNLLLKKLAECAGHTGIAGGQFLDLSYEKRKIAASKIINMQKKKTGKLFEFCCLAPSIVSGKNNKIKREMRTIGEELGFLFQIADDLLDVKGNKKNVGKPEVEVLDKHSCADFLLPSINMSRIIEVSELIMKYNYD